MKALKILFSLFFLSTFCVAQEVEFTIKPYLQDLEPNSAIIMWETNGGQESMVEYGKTPKLGQQASGKTESMNFGSNRLHTVKLEGLERFVMYYYRVKTGNVVSDIFQFKTPPFSSDRKSFNLIAMSDMQKDHNEPDKFLEVVNEGIISYLENEFEGEIPDNLAMVLIPGDLVVDGTVYEQWKNDFFNPAEKLFAEVPVYPAIGNHENNSNFYFKYFSLPENGTAAYAEHWWYKDYGNTRIIGLNSNKIYKDISSQYQWLKKLLDETAENKEIDFVFAQLHHPAKSELWIPGETDFSKKVVKLIENFSTKSGKPSIHFFGHTHGYSRGQSKEHKHLWINVASAGGAIDNWGEFEGRDYEEFSVTQDEYGFVMVEVHADKSNPSFTLKRISRGNQEHFRNNEERDNITVYKMERKPKAPISISPKGDVEDITGTTLKASPFQSDYSSAKHAASQWQLATDEAFEKVVLDRWKQSENWYYLENRQKEDDLSDEVTNRLKPNTTYYWRVRYRDQNLNWSDWSEVASFKTRG